jgi:hypothetical protein
MKYIMDTIDSLTVLIVTQYAVEEQSDIILYSWLGNTFILQMKKSYVSLIIPLILMHYGLIN